ncbi:hypothetical protein EVG20_g5816 [Dentipellis fragilis]|uniref:Uncharacterized protein n=1 Tax=Dentipellis fragilis TaxID=205917 RepID=A0A4Y9YR38_9AGAM|nr:hypothetical protein EVG20_g5816 [Dentipellis fragilis]
MVQNKPDGYIGGYLITIAGMQDFLEKAEGKPYESKLAWLDAFWYFENWYDEKQLSKKGIARITVYQESEEDEQVFIFPTHRALAGTEQIPEDDIKAVRDELINAMGHGFTAEKIQWVIVPGKKFLVWN